ncbi:hypothetical protein B9Z19DRAFT_257208 [Tuber borchii]|uniref:Uncharacterized protein n=1 Tax=Tuber borchii TaxID=42251 RepID=A0A2T6ZLG5_TUBBO|nr:hypothetical protein B9Z19DRAFT_257208 [Tuber borchii]
MRDFPRFRTCSKRGIRPPDPYLTVFETVFCLGETAFSQNGPGLLAIGQRRKRNPPTATACALGVAGVHVSGLNPLRNPRESRNVTLASLFVLNQLWTTSRAFSRPS